MITKTPQLPTGADGRTVPSAGRSDQTPPEDREFIDRVIAAFDGSPGALLGILEQVQDHTPHKYICRDTLRYISQKTAIPPSQIFSVVTFYALFNQAPQGEHTISICRGTACHTRGSGGLLESLRLDLGL